MIVGLLIHFCVVAVAMIIVSYLISGIQVKNFGSAFGAAIVLGLLNAFLRPILRFLTAPINWVTLGLFAFVINGILLKLAAEFIDGIKVKDWISAIIGSILITIVSVVIRMILPF